jgi:hypothetical protein
VLYGLEDVAARRGCHGGRGVSEVAEESRGRWCVDESSGKYRQGSCHVGEKAPGEAQRDVPHSQVIGPVNSQGTMGHLDKGVLLFVKKKSFFILFLDW